MILVRLLHSDIPSLYNAYNLDMFQRDDCTRLMAVLTETESRETILKLENEKLISDLDDVNEKRNETNEKLTLKVFETVFKESC